MVRATEKLRALTKQQPPHAIAIRRSQNGLVAEHQQGDTKSLTQSVLFVCWANICRSPAAASVFERFVRDHCLSEEEFSAEAPIIDSAGVAVHDCHQKASLKMRWAVYRRGYRLKRRARRIMRTDLTRFKLVVAMDRATLSEINRLHREPLSRVALIGEFLPHGMPSSVPDPMNRSLSTCNKVIDLLELACGAIARELNLFPKT